MILKVLKEKAKRLHLMDYICLSYLGILGILLLFFHKNVADWKLYVLIHAVLLLLITVFIWLGELYPGRKIFWVLRTFYPILIIAFGWHEMKDLVLMFYETFWTTNWLLELDKLIFKVHPTIWFQKFYRPWLNEFMYFLYAAYYLFLPGITLYLFFLKKKRTAVAVFSVVSLNYLSNFFLFLLLPAVGPKVSSALSSLHGADPAGYFFAWLNQLVQGNVGVFGAAFPSSHVSGALVWSLLAFRYFKKVGYIMAPAVLGIMVAAVYLGYHHALDLICGIVWGLICYFIGIAIIKQRKEDPKLTAA